MNNRCLVHGKPDRSIGLSKERYLKRQMCTRILAMDKTPNMAGKGCDLHSLPAVSIFNGGLFLLGVRSSVKGNERNPMIC
ncbi:hypothetical protein JOC78_002427 [Bacillus ectoiniformans]|uniref:hypothetical protein n=1 Tax=Bacillus ectoiniformans TaxID=1494429 RepID=UPI0019567A17|nr:hypothetical protein [Bacillus ectoiniformans]MBM7649474.1 hypothetical protein [Bacillus ectoiniformans]